MLAILKNSLARVRKRLAAPTGFARRQDGAAALEFAIVAAPFIALVLATIQTALAFFAGQVLEVRGDGFEPSDPDRIGAEREHDPEPDSPARSAPRCRRCSTAATS